MKRYIKSSINKGDLIQTVYDILNEYNNLAGAEVWTGSNDPRVYVEISGDWKHEHLLLDHILGQNGFLHIDTVEEGESGCDDYYTGIHSYVYAP